MRRATCSFQVIIATRCLQRTPKETVLRNRWWCYSNDLIMRQQPGNCLLSFKVILKTGADSWTVTTKNHLQALLKFTSSFIFSTLNLKNIQETAWHTVWLNNIPKVGKDRLIVPPLFSYMVYRVTDSTYWFVILWTLLMILTVDNHCYNINKAPHSFWSRLKVLLCCRFVEHIFVLLSCMNSFVFDQSGNGTGCRAACFSYRVQACTLLFIQCIFSLEITPSLDCSVFILYTGLEWMIASEQFDATRVCYNWAINHFYSETTQNESMYSKRAL